MEKTDHENLVGCCEDLGFDLGHLQDLCTCFKGMSVFSTSFFFSSLKNHLIVFNVKILAQGL